MGIETKTIGELIDQLSTTNILCFMEQEKIMTAPENSLEALGAAKKAQKLNARRNKLIRSIDILLGFGDNTVTEKTYG